MSEQGIEPCPDCGGQGGTDVYDQSGEPTHSKATCQRCDGTGELATPPVPAGEVGELVERLSYLGNAIENEFNPTALGGPSVGARECAKPMLDAAALLERYAAALEQIADMAELDGEEAPTIARAALSPRCSLR